MLNATRFHILRLARTTYKWLALALTLVLLLWFANTQGVPILRAESLSIPDVFDTQGNVELVAGKSGTLDVRGLSVQLDPQRGPVLAPNAPTANGWTAIGIGCRASRRSMWRWTTTRQASERRRTSLPRSDRGAVGWWNSRKTEMGLFTQKDLTEDWAVSIADVPLACSLFVEIRSRSLVSTGWAAQIEIPQKLPSLGAARFGCIQNALRCWRRN